jgi:hypothetical protein
MNLYIYSLEDLKHVATISGKDEGSIEAKANDAYDVNEYGWTYTYSPAFGTNDGLIENSEAEVISVD